MRRMTDEELLTAPDFGKWASICTVTPDNRPYAVEASYFKDDSGNICFMINPRGTTMANIAANPHVLVKITFAGPGVKQWIGVSCFGNGRVETDVDRMIRGWDLLGQAMGDDYSAAAKKFAQPGKPSPMLVVAPEKWTGRCSHKQGEIIDFAWFTH